MKIHAAAELFPMLQKQELQSLAADIKENGLLVPIVKLGDSILDGRNRLRACEIAGVEPTFQEWYGKGSPISWVISMNAKRRHLTPGQMACVAVDALPLYEAEAKKRQKMGKAPVPEGKGQARDKLAHELKVSARYIQDAKKLKISKPEVFKEVASGKTNLKRAMRNLKAEEYREKRIVPDALIEKSLAGVELICGDIKSVGKKIKDESIDAIITDPPYPKEFLKVYDDLGFLASRTLKPGGSLFIMIGHSYLPEILRRLELSKMEYHWTLCYLTEGAEAAQIWERKVLTYWKPILWFVKGKFKGDWSSDVIKSEKNDKRFHKWGQDISGFCDLINRYTLPGQTVLDPFLGGGTTGLAAVKLGRKFIGIDIDESSIEISKGRISEVCPK